MNMKRMRGRNHRSGGGGGGGGGGFRNQQNGIPLNRNHVFDSSGPEMRVRGTAQQLFEKYQQMARDASSNGDRVLGEAYYQHAEHYFRIISAINQAQGQPNGQASGQPSGQANGQPNPHGQTAGGQPYQNNNNGQDRGNYQNGHQNGDYNRRSEASEAPETQSENRYENRTPENRNQENRQQERRFENRPYEQRGKPDFQPRQERQDRPEREQRFRQETVMPDPRIDISSALEAELAAAAGSQPEPAGFGEQPRLPEPAIEARAIPIIPDAPPPAEAHAELPAERQAEMEAAPVRAPRPRGRPRTPKPEAAEVQLESPDTEAE